MAVRTTEGCDGVEISLRGYWIDLRRLASSDRGDHSQARASEADLGIDPIVFAPDGHPVKIDIRPKSNGIDRRAHRRENEQIQKAVFALLHEPPSAIGINRTTWRMVDLTKALRERGTPVCAQVVREITRSAGWRWRKARKVLTSNDPEYRQKVRHIQRVLGELQDSEAFFSIDEFGPFSVRAQGGRVLVAPGEVPTVPQYQKSKGCLIMTAALKLS